MRLQDVWRCKHPNESQFTWRDKAFKVQCRLDYWLDYKELSRIVIKTEMKSSTLTDHSAITLTLQSKGYAQRGSGFWKFNNSLLDDLVFVEQLYNAIPFLTLTPRYNEVSRYRKIPQNFVIAGFISTYFTVILLGFQMLFVLTGSSL